MDFTIDREGRCALPGSDGTFDRGIRVCGKRVKGLVPGRIDRRVCGTSDLNIVRCSRVRKILQSSQCDVVQHGVQFGLLRSRDVVHLERACHAAAQNQGLEITNFGIALRERVAGADITHECIDRCRVDQESAARHVAVESHRFDNRFVWIALEFRRAGQLHNTDRQCRIFQNLSQFTGVQ